MLVPMGEDETATITVVDGETELVNRTVTQDCEDEITTTTTVPGDPSTTTTVPGEVTTTTVPVTSRPRC